MASPCLRLRLHLGRKQQERAVTLEHKQHYSLVPKRGSRDYSTSLCFKGRHIDTRGNFLTSSPCIAGYQIKQRRAAPGYFQPPLFRPTGLLCWMLMTGLGRVDGVIQGHYSPRCYATSEYQEHHRVSISEYLKVVCEWW